LDLFGRLEEPVHVLLTDLVMPRLGGAELARRLLAAAPGLPVVYMTGYSDHAVDLPRPPAMAQPVLLQKPLSDDLLARRLREVLGE
jgi:CheY-like chemotaxis protein